jgi:hypothetical protein
MSPIRSIPPRIRRTPDHVRDSSLIIIATEGEKTEKQYFEGIKSLFKSKKVNILILPNIDHQSSPEQVMEVIDKFLDDFKLEVDDQCWLIIDLDRWKTETLSNVAGLCLQKNISFAVSNPCFEFWLLLHVAYINDYSNEQKKLMLVNRKVGTNRTWLNRELVRRLGSYNKSNLQFSYFSSGINQAITQAENLDVNPEHRWPNELGSRVYRLVKIIMSYSSNG